MKFSLVSSLEKREGASLLILPFWEGAAAAANLGKLKEDLLPILNSGDFKGKNGECALFYLEGGKEERILLLGLGKEEKASHETLRKAYANGVKVAFSKKGKTLNLLLPNVPPQSRDSFVKGVIEGVLLSNYGFHHLKGDSLKEAPPLIEKISWIGLEKQEEALLLKTQSIVGGVYFARELVNGNADDVTPEMLAKTALSFEKLSSKLKTVVYDKKWLEQNKMGLILAVNRASSLDPYLIQVSYRGNPKSKEHILLVGKGVTYDTGGLALKPLESMLSMKCDMAGGAVVLGAVQTAALLGLKVNVTALVPAVENCIDAKSYKLGDVYRSYSGKTIEVNNTDAEGRLVLADAISYGVENLHPTCIIDLATLTGNVVLALGEEYAGLFSNDSKLVSDLMNASEETGELLWRLPIHAEYKEAYKSDIADLLNSAGRDAGAIKGALFLQEFTKDVPWAHIDIAGPSFWTKPKYYHPTKATGYGVRLLVEFLERRGAK